MKKIIVAMTLLLSTQTFAAETVSCRFENTVHKNVIVPDVEVVRSIINAQKSGKNENEKIKIIKSALYIDSIAIGDGKGFCELAKKQYKVDADNCTRLLKSTDFANQIMLENISNESDLACFVGLNAKVILGFKM